MGFRESIEASLGQLACSVAQNYRTLVQNNPALNSVINGPAPERDSYAIERLYCNKDPFTAPFKPGKCPARYTVQVVYRQSGDLFPGRNGTFTVNFSGWGPIGGATVRRIRDGGGPNEDRYFIDLSNYGPVNLARGSQEFSTIAGPAGASSVADVVILSTESTIFPADAGLPCDLDQPPPPYRPEDFTFPVNVPYTPPGGTEITIPLVAVVGLFYADVDLNLNMPVKFSINPTANIDLNFDFEFTGTLNLSTGDTKIDFIGGDNPGAPPPALPPTSRPPITDPTNPAPPRPPSVPDAEPDPEDAEENRQLIGVVVTSTVPSGKFSATTIFQDDNPDIFAPSLGFVSFAIRTVDGVVGWTNDIPVKNLRAYIPVPENCTAIKAAGTPRPEVAWVITPVYERALVLAGGD